MSEREVDRRRHELKAKKARELKPDKLTLEPRRIYVKDFGPIREADIELGKLTILMGPNNTGKTFTAALIPALEGLIISLTIIASVPIFKSDEKEYERFLKNRFNEIVINIYSVDDPRQLIRRGSDNTVLSYWLSPIEVLKGDHQLKIEFDRTGGMTFDLDGLRELINNKIAPLLSPVVFIPAERAGIMRTYKQLLRLHLETSWSFVPPSLRQKGVERLGSKVRLPGLVRMLLDEILSIERFTLEERQRSDVGGALEVLEEEVLRGRLEMGEDLSVKYHEAAAENPIDLINASSMVSEVSAIYLLSGMLRRGGWLIIEEPEAHVHPRGQMGLARFMARLVRLGVNVVATTHSDLIALKLAQMVGLAKLSPEQRRSLGYREAEYLQKDELALYFFEPTESGSVTRKVEVSETGEVEDLPTYSRVTEEMYGEAVKLLELHGKIPKLP
ncbi:MAG: AAA family ATPase [Nitrososphaerota archaeon]